MSPPIAKGRPQNTALTRRILSAALLSLAQRGYHGMSLALLAEEQSTSKQALYRRWPTKQALALDALRYGFRQVPPVYPGTQSLQQDLSQAMTNQTHALTQSPLGGAWRALLAEPDLREELELLEGEQRTHLRQVFVYWNATAHMETSIDQLMGFVFFTALVRGKYPDHQELNHIIHSVTSR